MKQTAVEWLIDEMNNIKGSSISMNGSVQFIEKELNNLFEQAKAMEKEKSNAKIQKAIEKFEEAKSKSSSLKDIVYLDGVLAVLDTIKNETFKSE